MQHCNAKVPAVDGTEGIPIVGWKDGVISQLWRALHPRTRSKWGHRIAYCTVLLVGTQFAAGGPAAQQLTIVYPNEKNAFHDAAAEILKQAYQKLGIKLTFKTFPAERALKMSNGGAADGELVRIAGISRQYPNLRRIPVDHVSAEQMAFSSDPTIKILGWESLRHYKFAFHRGYKVAEKNTAGMDRYVAGSPLAALRMVKHGRMDIALANRFTGEKILRDERFQNIVMLTPPVQVDPLYHYLHAKNQHLVAPITRIMTAMKAQGEMRKIRNRFGVAQLK